MMGHTFGYNCITNKDEMSNGKVKIGPHFVRLIRVQPYVKNKGQLT